MPTVKTNARDYAPGSTADITADGFGFGNDIFFTIQVIDPLTGALFRSESDGLRRQIRYS